MTEQIQDETLYTATEASRLADLTDSSFIRRLLIDGVIKGRKLGNQWVVTGRDLREWLEHRPRRRGYKPPEREAGWAGAEMALRSSN